MRSPTAWWRQRLGGRRAALAGRGRGAGAKPGRRGGPGAARRTRPLSWRIGAFVAAVTTLALALMVVASGLAMRHWMTAEVDSQLARSLQRVAAIDQGGGPAGGLNDQSGQDPRGLGGPGSSPGSLQLVSSDGSVRAGVVEDYAVQSLTDEQVVVLLQVTADERGHSVDLPELGGYRVMARDQGDARVLVGQSLVSTNRTATTLMWTTGVLALVIAAVAVVAGWFWVRREMRPLARVAHTARDIGRRELASGAVEPLARVPADDARPGTEVGDVGAALNGLLDNVESALTERERSERRLRQFVADASHELRTPLASIQGYTQLLQRDSIDSQLALARIGSESKRMGGLVEDMLLLARLDAGRALAAKPVDMVPLVVDAVHDAHAAGPDHRWSLDVAPDAADTCVVRGDEASLRQVLANLLSNARVHTPAGTQVRVGVAARDGQVVVRIADDGPGIPPGVRERVFDRFVRGDASRSRTRGSSGLGLSIVESVARAHGGSVEFATTCAGEVAQAGPRAHSGTCFTVRLPRFSPQPQPPDGGRGEGDDPADPEDPAPSS